jgi:hypothetical protein
MHRVPSLIIFPMTHAHGSRSVLSTMLLLSIVLLLTVGQFTTHAQFGTFGEFVDQNVRKIFMNKSTKIVMSTFG